MIFFGNTYSLNLNLGPRNDNEAILKQDLNHEFFLINVSREPDYDREIIKGSMRPLRRKTTITKLIQGVHSPLFVEMVNPLFFLFLVIFWMIYPNIGKKCAGNLVLIIQNLWSFRKGSTTNTKRKTNEDERRL